LTFNSLTDMINNNTLSKWAQKIKTDLKEHFGFRSVLMATTAIILGVLGVIVTCLTAGTWWTIVKEAPKVFRWMAHVPKVIINVFMPFFLGVSALIFNLENTAETLEHLEEVGSNPKHSIRLMISQIGQTLKRLWKQENIAQLLNPFRLLIKLTFTPIRILLFLGHLLSIAVTSDRVPGVSEIASALVGLLLEGFTDGHYFFQDLMHKHEEKAHPPTDKEAVQKRLSHEGGHDHSTDIPTQLLRWCFTPLFAAAAAWHFVCSTEGYTQERWDTCWNKFYNIQPDHVHSDIVPEETIEPLSHDFKVHMAIHRIGAFRRKENVTAFSKEDGELNVLQRDLNESKNGNGFNKTIAATALKSRSGFFQKLERLVELDKTEVPNVPKYS
jgi:hypothetical protein